MYLKTLLAVVFVSAAIPAFAQVVPEANAPSIPLAVGVGYSNYSTDWSGRLEGPTLWVDWKFDRGPAFVHGLGLEMEARDLNYGRSVPKLRMDTLSGGVIYTIPHLHRFNPYVKFLVGYGSIDFAVNIPNYTHDTRTVYTPAGGLDYRVFRNVIVRGNYDYQFWADFFNHHALNPNGLTVGVSYDLGGIRER
jgi:opacity protein-like surface antigen